MEEPLSLRPVTLKDAPFLVKWYNDAENVKYMSTWVRCRKHTLKFIQKELRNMDPDYERLFMICKKGQKNPIGHAGIDDMDLHDQRGEVFIVIGDTGEKGKGYGVMAMKQLITYAFYVLKLNSLFATATVNNTASIKMLKKVGFRKVGVRKEYHRLGQKYLDEVLFELLRKDYLK